MTHFSLYICIYLGMELVTWLIPTHVVVDVSGETSGCDIRLSLIKSYIVSTSKDSFLQNNAGKFTATKTRIYTLFKKINIFELYFFFNQLNSNLNVFFNLNPEHKWHVVSPRIYNIDITSRIYKKLGVKLTLK